MLIVIILNWPQFLSLWGLGAETPRFRIALKPDPLPWTYVVAFLSAVLVFEVLPYLEELVRGWRFGSKERPGIKRRPVKQSAADATQSGISVEQTRY